MEAIERAAHISVGRACGFCGLAIFCLMVGFSYEPHLSARVGGLFTFAVACVLAFKAAIAARTPYKKTETWLILADEHKPPSAYAQSLISGVLRKVYLQYAQYCAFAAAVLLGVSLLLKAVIA
jgi:hypothetical protein